MARGRNRYIKVKVICGCGWKGKRSTFMSRNPCPKCGKRPVGKVAVLGMRERGGRTFAKVIPNRTIQTIQGAIHEHVEVGSQPLYFYSRKWAIADRVYGA